MMLGLVEKSKELLNGRKRKALVVAILVFVSLTATVWGFSASSDAGAVTRYAVVVGINEYKSVRGLSYCNQDANDWYAFLNRTMSFNFVWMFGDHQVASYLKYDGVGTEHNVKQALKNMVQKADSNDIIAFIFSGHGSGNGEGSSCLCTWDLRAGENGEDGRLYDTELADILEQAVANKIFVFLDSCLSGGFCDDLMSLSNNQRIYLTTTCTSSGYGYDDPVHKNGEWTYFFLEYSWIDHYKANPNAVMEDVFAYASAHYPNQVGGCILDSKDQPQQYDGDVTQSFSLDLTHS
jgi:hypothetical protein